MTKITFCVYQPDGEGDGEVRDPSTGFIARVHGGSAEATVHERRRRESNGRERRRRSRAGSALRRT